MKTQKMEKLKTLKDILEEALPKELIGKSTDEIIKEFIKRRKARLRNQIRIHWNWLKEKSSKEVSDFIIKIANAEAGEEMSNFNLSEKRQDRKHPNYKKPFNNEFTYPEEDVKEFIRLLKINEKNLWRIIAELLDTPFNLINSEVATLFGKPIESYLNIDKLAGKSLI